MPVMTAFLVMVLALPWGVSGERGYKPTRRDGRASQRPPCRLSCSPSAVLRLVVFQVGAAADALRPGGVVPVPLHRPPQAVLEGDGRLPAQLALDFRAIDGVPAVVAGPVLDEFDQR